MVTRGCGSSRKGSIHELIVRRWFPETSVSWRCVAMTTLAASVGDHFDTYLSEIRKVPLLSREREREVARSYRDTRDPSAGQLLVTSNLRFVVRIAREYCSEGRRMADLVQEGNLGLLQAVERFDPDKEVRLVSYAVTWIRSRILNHILQSWSLVKVGTTSAQRRLFFSLTRTQKDLEGRCDPGEPGDPAKMVTMLARCFGVEPSVIVEMRQRLDARDVSLDAPTPRGDESSIDSLAAGDARQDDLLSLAEETDIDCVRVRAALGCLDDRERLVIQLRVMAEPSLSLEAVGQRLGCGRERARQLEVRAKKKLRTCLEGCGVEKECRESRVVVRCVSRPHPLGRTG
jgi:RNA polymerase sigma-32 factor